MQRNVVKSRHFFLTIKLSDSDGFCGFQKMPKKSDTRRGSEDGHVYRIGCAFRPLFKYDTIS